MSKLYYIYSAMNSGKTARLIQNAYNYEERGHEIKVFTSEIDNRYERGTVTSRIGLSRPATVISTNSTKEILDFIEELKYDTKIKAVFVDECQFLNREHIDLLSDIVDDYDIPVYCYGIRTDYSTELFSGSSRLFAIADELEEIPSICECGKNTKMNARLINDDSKILVGGNDIYQSMCRKCYKKLIKGKSNNDN